jgi:hypothetical protein
MTTVDRSGAGTATRVPPPRGTSPLQDIVDRLPRSRRQRRTGMAAIGVVLIGGCATVAAGLVARGDHTVAVLALARDVPAGQVVSAADLRVAHIGGSGVSAMSASSLPTVIGETAVESLTAGTLVQQAMFSRAPVPASGLQVVAVAEKASLVPAGVTPGRLVSLVLVASNASHGGTGGALLVPSARVVGVRTDPTGGTTVLSVEVPADAAPAVAQAVAAGSLAVTLLPVSP